MSVRTNENLNLIQISSIVSWVLYAFLLLLTTKALLAGNGVYVLKHLALDFQPSYLLNKHVSIRTVVRGRCNRGGGGGGGDMSTPPLYNLGGPPMYWSPPPLYNLGGPPMYWSPPPLYNLGGPPMYRSPSPTFTTTFILIGWSPLHT